MQPFVSRQQELELAIKACKSLEQVNAVNITYDDVGQVS